MNDRINELEKVRQNYAEQFCGKKLERCDFKEILSKAAISLQDRDRIKQYEDNKRLKNIEYYKQQIPETYWSADINKIDIRIRNFLHNDKTFCWIYGACGIGKTYSLYALKKQQLLQGSFIIKIYKEYDINFDTNFYGFLAIDDFGISENNNRNIVLLDIYFKLIDTYIENKNKLIITSNYSINEWLKKMEKCNEATAQRIASRFSNITDMIKLEGNDKRKGIIKHV